MTKKKRLTFVISSLQDGGAERVMTIMANYWAAAGWNITLLTLDDGVAPLSYDLDSRVRHVPLAVAEHSGNTPAALRNGFRRLRALRRSLRQSRPDAILSFMDITNVTTILATQGLGVPVIISERSDPARHFPGRIWSKLRQLLYPLADAVVVQSQGALDYFSPKVQARARIIPNPVLSAQPSTVISSIQLPRPALVTMGRLVQSKGFDLLLRAFAQIKDKRRDWTLVILGDGPLRTELESLRNQLGLEQRVLMPGRVNNPYNALVQSDLFVMSSRYEGFPNALCEAMACGLAVVCTDCPSGPREIIRDGIDGILVANEDVAALTKAIDQLMENKIERARLGERATDVTTRFALSEVMRLWEDTLAQVIGKRLPMLNSEYQQERLRRHRATSA